MRTCMCVCVCVCVVCVLMLICVSTEVCMEVNGQPQVLVLELVHFETVSLVVFHYV